MWPARNDGDLARICNLKQGTRYARSPTSYRPTVVKLRRAPQKPRPRSVSRVTGQSSQAIRNTRTACETCEIHERYPLVKQFPGARYTQEGSRQER